MSRKNKVNPDHYKVAGRLSADDLARERMKQSAPKTARAWDERPGQPTWMDGRSAGPAPAQATTPRLQGRVRRGGRLAPDASQKAAPRRKRRSRPRARGDACLQAVCRREAGAESGDAQEQEGICREEENGPQDARTALSGLRPT